MQPKNTIKFLASLAVVAVFVLTLVSSSQNDNELKTPKLLPIGNSARVVDTLPVSGVVENPIISPITISTLTPTLQLTSQSGLYYVFYIHNVSGSTASPIPAFTSDYIKATGTKTSFTLLASQPNVRLSFGLVDGSTYAWSAKACADAQGSRCSDSSAYSYFKVMLSTATERPGSILIYSTDSSGATYKFDDVANTWIKISDGTVSDIVTPSETQATTKPLGIYATTSDGKTLEWNGTDWVAVSTSTAPTTVLGTIGTAIGNVFNTIGTVATNAVKGLVNIFKPSVPTTPTSTTPDIYSTGADGSISKFNATTGKWEIVTPGATGIISSPCTDQFGFPGTLNPSGGCDPLNSVRTNTTNQPVLYSTDASGVVYKFDSVTNKWVSISGTATTSAPVLPAPAPKPTSIRTIPVVNSILNIFSKPRTAPAPTPAI